MPLNRFSYGCSGSKFITLDVIENLIGIGCGKVLVTYL
jgi:hypothetical protein